MLEPFFKYHVASDRKGPYNARLYPADLKESSPGFLLKSQPIRTAFVSRAQWSKVHDMQLESTVPLLRVNQPEKIDQSHLCLPTKVLR